MNTLSESDYRTLLELVHTRDVSAITCGILELTAIRSQLDTFYLSNQLVSSKIQNEALDLRTSATVGSTKSVGKVCSKPAESVPGNTDSLWCAGAESRDKRTRNEIDEETVKLFKNGKGVTYSANNNSKMQKPTYPSKRPRKCTICGKVVRADNFEVHYRSHTGEKPYKCPFCPFRSANPSSMPKHLKLHECGRMPQYCAHCQYSTTSKANLITHYQTYHMHLQSTGSRDDQLIKLLQGQKPKW